MIEVRVHGRGGQGGVTFVELLAKAAGLDGKYVQAFPSFGPERTGAPVKAFCRIDNIPVTLRSQIYSPDFVVVLDPSLLDLPEVIEGIKPETVIIVNSDKGIELNIKNKVYTIDATKLAMEILGRPITNTAMLGAFIKVLGLVKLESVLKTIDEKFPEKIAEPNKKLISQSYELMVVD
ncbi:MAG: pyruvate ferredoxin oxidoreductase subunit gamma [Candidatus Aenigmarchaeota archaeon]|nr:pyruvate ferredoxin oxidoreductase subunit gamma [Candidatus Aenigmarchaeota archaeon]